MARSGHSHRFPRKVLRVLDSVAGLAALGSTAWLLAGHSAARALLWPDEAVGWWMLLAVLAVGQTTFHTFGLYGSRRWAGQSRELRDIFRASFLVAVSVSAMIAGFTSAPSTLRTMLPAFAALYFLASSLAAVGLRVGVQRRLERRRIRGWDPRYLVMVGTNPRARGFVRSILARPELGYRLLGHVDDPWDGLDAFLEALGPDDEGLLCGLADFADWARGRTERIDEVVVALPVTKAYVHGPDLLDICLEIGATVRFFTPIFDSRLANAKLEVFDDEPMLSLAGTADSGFSRLVKAIFDRIAAFLLLIAISPLVLAVALAVKLTSSGPILFVQERIGYNKRRFRLYKFRTMVENAEQMLAELEHLNEVSGPVFKLERDPRSTPIGDFLRRTSLDELPQLLNVLTGDMSLVGPRPLPLRDYAGFDSDAHRRRLSVKPGMTGLWQVSGRNSIDFDRWMELDLEYIDNWSLWLDLKLLLLTLPEVLGPLLPGSSKKGGSFERRGGF